VARTAEGDTRQIFLLLGQLGVCIVTADGHYYLRFSIEGERDGECKLISNYQKINMDNDRGMKKILAYDVATDSTVSISYLLHAIDRIQRKKIDDTL
jgi:hypothetical protein